MKITIRNNNGLMTRKEICQYLEWLAENLMSKRLTNKLSLLIEVKKLPGAKATMVADDDTNKSFVLELSDKMGRYEIMKALAHEMVHVKQYATRELYQYVSHGYRYQGVKYPDSTDYYDQPWEIEAFGREVGLYRRYMRHLHKLKKAKKKS